MSADLLREAAALMRQRAESATPGPWAEWNMLDDGRVEVFVPNGSMSTETVFEFKDHMDCEECHRPTMPDVEHIASWHPAVALAVADWLTAVSVDFGAPGHREWHGPEREAVNVARAYLGRDS